ncbi:MAG: hypothetical protein PHE21_00130 [Candidatus Dojkabacteria bacterium]|nr:hypothetical protein [Candidatus Dojkabacteria bacterium]
MEKLFNEGGLVIPIKGKIVPFTREEWNDLRIVPPSVYKELKRQKANMKRYVKSKLIKIKDKKK